MMEDFDRAPGAGRARSQYPAGIYPGGDQDSTSSILNQRQPLRQPRTSPPSAEIGAKDTDSGGGCARLSKPQQIENATGAYPEACNDADSLLKLSNLSASAPVFVPYAFSQNEDPALYLENENENENESHYSEPILADAVSDFLDQLGTSPGTFDSDVENITDVLNSWVTTEELLKELVELIYMQSTTLPNFAYTGARLCNYLSHHLTINPPGGNFRQLLLKRCQKEFGQKDEAVLGDEETQKRFHSFVLFLGELYLHLEVKSAKGPPKRADILLSALKDLLMCLFSSPVDANLICAVKLLKLTGSVLDDAWSQSGQPHMEQIISKIENILLDAACSRDVRQMLLKLVELRSSDWGRVRSAAASSNATPDNDPNYFMNEPTFYTEDGIPFTAADPEYAEKYQEILDRQNYFYDFYGESANDVYDFEDDMGSEIEEAYESFCRESERRRQQ